MAQFGTDDDLKAAAFDRADLTGARFERSRLRGVRITSSDLSGMVVRGSDVMNVEIDSPWIGEGDFFRVNGVDVIPLVEAALNARFPGRELQRADDPAGLQAAWGAVQDTWAATLERAESMPAGTVEESVDGEWSLSQTLRHLVMATDTWLGKAVLRLEQPYHPLGLADDGTAEGLDPSVFSTQTPTYAEVLVARADRTQQVGDFIDQASVGILAEERANPHAPQHPETVLSCLHTILEEEWEHHRYAVRDLDALEQRTDGP